MKKIVCIIILFTSLLFATAVFCACGNSGSESTASPQLDYYTVNFEVHPVIGGGHIEGKTSQKIKKGESTEKITAVADYGYYFSGWMGETIFRTMKLFRVPTRLYTTFLKIYTTPLYFEKLR